MGMINFGFSKIYFQQQYHLNYYFLSDVIFYNWWSSKHLKPNYNYRSDDDVCILYHVIKIPIRETNFFLGMQKIIENEVLLERAAAAYIYYEY